MIEIFCDYLTLIRVLRYLTIGLTILGGVIKFPPLLIGGGISSLGLLILGDISNC